jgi:transcriptional regulator with XRE-family HTH domain
MSKGRGWTQERLAYEAKVAVATISRLERGERNASPLVAFRIAKALGVSVEEAFPEPEKVA